MSDTWQMIRHQLSYLKYSVAFVWLAVFSLGVPIALLLDKPTAVGAVWKTLIVLGGLFLCFRYWFSDLKERRSLLWLGLPVSNSAIALVRVVLPVLLQLSLLVPVLLTMPAWLGQGARELLGEILALQGLVLGVVMACYLVEEICVLLSPWRWAVILFNFVVGLPVLLLFLLPESAVPILGAWGWAAIGHLAAAGMGGLVLWLFRRRSSYLVGINPWHGLPVDWSVAPD